MTELLAQIPLDFICLGVLGPLWLRKLVRMEKYHWPRVVILTVLLWVPAVCLFLLVFTSSAGCVLTSEECDAFTCVEL